MRHRVSEFPKKPLPHVPATPQEPQRAHIQPPTVFVYEKQGWEYKVVTGHIADDAPLSEDELNALGKDGWELQFYMKRLRR